MRVSSVDLQSARLEWIAPQYPRPEFITGYQLVVNGDSKTIFERDLNEFLFTDFQPGHKYEVSLLTLTNSIVGQSPPSNKIIIQCPHRPSSPMIAQFPTIRTNSVVIGWKPVEPKTSSKFDRVTIYK